MILRSLLSSKCLEPHCGNQDKRLLAKKLFLYRVASVAECLSKVGIEREEYKLKVIMPQICVEQTGSYWKHGTFDLGVRRVEQVG